MRELSITVKNHPYHVKEYGSYEAPTLVCLHGLTGDSNSFLELIEHLIHDFHIITLDSPGHGQTAPYKQEEDYLFSPLVVQINKVIEQITDAPIYIVGHSWGADLALNFAKTYPDKVKGLILLDGGYVFPEQVKGLTEEKAIVAWEKYIETSTYDTWEELVKTYQGYLTRKWDETIERIIASNFKKVEENFVLKADKFSVKAIMKAFYKEPCSTTYEHINCSVLLCHATIPEADPSRRSGIELIRQNVTNIKVIGIENTKHNIHWDNPKMVSNEILLWIKRTSLS